MKGYQMFIFFGVFFTLYAGFNYFIFIRGWQALHNFAPKPVLIIYVTAFLLFSMSYLFMRFTAKILPPGLADVLAFYGGLWFAAMLYFLMFILLFDIIRLIAGNLTLYPAIITANWAIVKATSLAVAIVVTITLMIVGNHNANNLKVREVVIDVDKHVPGMTELNIAFASDIHLGHIVGEKHLTKIITEIQKLKPDIILFPGDLVDEELQPVIQKNLGRLFTTLSAPYGIYAVTGNHEYIGGANAAVEYLSKFNIRFLRDTTLLINNAFYLAGREDLSMNGFTGTKRKSLNELLSKADTNLPVILMDHQPINLAEAVQNQVDLQISGHTHHGQMWPLNYATERIFKLSWGYKKIENSHFYVSSGAGTWGPHVRIGNQPEIVHIKLRFRQPTENHL
jgi:predicted MPP superfamily phosphohydrolase